MAKRQLVAGLIGAGRIGKMHGENILAHMPDVFLKAVADPKLDFSWAESVGIPKCFKDAKTLLKDRDIQAVVIAASTTAHVKLICSAAEAGKDIFCEKPIGFEPDSIKEAIDAIERCEVKLQVGYNRRFDPDFKRVHDVVQSGKIGTPHIIKITNRDPARPNIDYVPESGGLFIDFCVHDFDTTRFVSSSNVKEVYAMGAVLIDPEIGNLGDIDTALISLKLSSGALCIIDNSRETHYGYDQQVEVFGSNGTICAENTSPTHTVLSTSSGVFTEKPYYSFVERYREAYVSELREFFNCVHKGTDPPVTGKDALAAIKIAVAAECSYKQNRPVRVEP